MNWRRLYVDVALFGLACLVTSLVAGTAALLAYSPTGWITP